MPSTRRRPRQPEPDRPTIFLDRSVGRTALPPAIKALGFTIHTLWDIYGEHQDEDIDDDVWITDSARNGWVALTWDMLKKPRRHRQTIADTGARVFRFERNLDTAQAQIDAFTVNQYRFIQRAQRPGPYIDVIRSKTIDRYWTP